MLMIIMVLMIDNGVNDWSWLMMMLMIDDDVNDWLWC